MKTERDYQIAAQQAWLAGFRAHRDGDQECKHGYTKGDHHWESGDCLSLTRAPSISTFICRHGMTPLENGHSCDEMLDRMGVRASPAEVWCADCEAGGRETVMVLDADYGGHLCPVCEPQSVALMGNHDERERLNL